MATIRPGAAPTTPANRCPSCCIHGDWDRAALACARFCPILARPSRPGSACLPARPAHPPPTPRWPMGNLTIVDHPPVQHKLTRMRDRATSTASFRRLPQEIAHLLCYEVTRDLETELVEVETPRQPTMAP